MTQWLIDTFIATSGLILLVLVLREPVRRRFGPSVAYALWLLPAARLAMPSITRTVERVVPAPAETPLALSTADVAGAALAPAPTLLEQLGGWPTVLIAFWLSVAAVMIAAGTVTYLRQRRSVLGQGVQLARLGRVRIVRSEAIRGPMAFGLIDQVIAVPTDFEIRYDERQRRLALDHELAHHASGDLWANLIAFVLLCLQWFNPLAWAAHAAFRFDQEAACDARVLDKADGPDRAAYGQAIAKAASGRVLLFAGALDRPTTLSRRLNSMLISSNPRRRLAGKVLIAAGVAAALPLTATWATNYVDRIVPVRPLPPTSPIMPVAAIAASAVVQPVPALDPVPAVAPVPAVPAVPAIAPVHNPDSVNVRRHGGKLVVTKDGKAMEWNELTPAERKRIRADIDRARHQLATTRIDRPEIDRSIREAMQSVRESNAEMHRDLAEAKRDIAHALAEVDRNAVHIRAAGHNPEQIKAQVRASLARVRPIDPVALRAQIEASIDHKAIEASIRGAQASIRRSSRELERLDADIARAEARAEASAEAAADTDDE